MTGWPVMFAAALVNNIVPDPLQPSTHAHERERERVSETDRGRV